MNPFDQSVNRDCLFNNVTGKAVSPKVCDFLTNANTMDHQQKLQFLEEYASSPDRFEKPIKRNTILNFASDCIKKVQKSSEGKQAIPPKNHIEIIDGFYFLNVLGPSFPQTFGKISEHVLRKICGKDALEIHLVFDRYLSPSIKDAERHNRQEVDIPFSIVGPLRKRQLDFNKSLKNFRFKEALVEFFVQYWEDYSMTSFIQNKTVFITVQERCYSYRSVNGRIFKKEEGDFECQHEEADTLILFHMNKINQNSTILVTVSDTDVPIILLGNIHTFPDMDIYLVTSFAHKEDFKCYSINDVATSLSPNICRALSAFHAFIGCDYTATFYRQGKVPPFKLLQKND
ncbi:unnamed protein product [Psylliodes chrysocephalus]|uniref:Uncharacterized protein n=1 Tax=Psylliodes chrysocephalus TaxID=3402493 RepID=A0A9P0CIN8_9CUCU|nr:unnamed protein product [Psylliodes chrysocephala]